MTDEMQEGLIAKYTVQRHNDVEGKHEHCWYFVLDPRHDSLAIKALQSYRDAAYDAGYQELARDLTEKIFEYKGIKT